MKSEITFLDDIKKRMVRVLPEDNAQYQADMEDVINDIHHMVEDRILDIEDSWAREADKKKNE